MDFIVGRAKRYNADPILTFHQPLFKKSYLKYNGRNQNSFEADWTSPV